MLEQLNFFKIALRDHQVGALARSSKYVVNAVVSNFDHQLLHRVIEYGPGDGVVTREILKRMSIDGQLFVVETNPTFLSILRDIRDPKLIVIEGTAQEASKVLSDGNQGDIDLIISSIPFSKLSPDEREGVVRCNFRMLKNTGKFIIYHQYSLLMLNLLNKYFNKGALSTQFELRNILPCFIMIAQK